VLGFQTKTEIAWQAGEVGEAGAIAERQFVGVLTDGYVW
jgi:hypothetical protein